MCQNEMIRYCTFVVVVVESALLESYELKSSSTGDSVCLHALSYEYENTLMPLVNSGNQSISRLSTGIMSYTVDTRASAAETSTQEL